MNSQIYSLPIKFGWNSVQKTSTSEELYYQQQRYVNKSSKNPISPSNNTVRFQKHPRESLTATMTSDCACANTYSSYSRSRPKLKADRNRALLFSYSTQYTSDFGPDTSLPVHKRPTPSSHEQEPDPLRWRSRRYDPPFQKVALTKGTPLHDTDKGYHEWCRLMVGPGDSLWQPLERVHFWDNVGERYTLPPPRIQMHNLEYERGRWDTIKSLESRNRLAYGYRKNMAGYTGFQNMSEHVTSDVEKNMLGDNNKAMESTAQATFRELPDEFYNHFDAENANKHKGPLSRMVTLTHPFNPFTQQSAYSNMGAANTRSNQSSSCVSE